MVDLLGFKESPLTTSEKLNAVKNMRSAVRADDAFIKFQHSKAKGGGDSTIDLEFLSDTFCVGVKDEVGLDGYSVLVATYMVRKIINSALEEGFAVRGCIAYGEFVFDEQIIVGDAVFQAASSMERSQEACVWLQDSALTALNKFVSWFDGSNPDGTFDLQRRLQLPRCQINLKEVGPIETRVVNPFFLREADKAADHIQRTLATMPLSRLDVWSKRTMTENHLRSLENSLRKDHDEYRVAFEAAMSGIKKDKNAGDIR